MIWILLMESPAGSTRSVTGVEQDLLACRLLVDIQEPLLAAVKRGWNLHGLGMSPVFRASWRLDDAVVSRGNAGWTMSKSGHPYPYQNYSRWPPAEKIGKASLMNCPSCPPSVRQPNRPRDRNELLRTKSCRRFPPRCVRVGQNRYILPEIVSLHF